jgi:DNA mismatch repair protein MutS
MNRMLISLTLCLSMLLSTPLALQAKGEKKKKKDEHLVTSLANEYMRAFAVEEDEDEEGEEDSDKKPAADAQKPQEGNKDNVITFGFGKSKIEVPMIGKLSDMDRYKIAFNLLDVHVNQGKLPVNKTIDKTFIRSMELVYGGTEGKNNLIRDINYSNGIVAETALAWTCAQPFPDIASIKHNQALIKELTRDQGYFLKLSNLVEKLATLEESVLSFYSPADTDFYQALIKLGLYPPLGATSPKIVGSQLAILFGMNGVVMEAMAAFYAGGGLIAMYKGVSMKVPLASFVGACSTALGAFFGYTGYQAISNIAQMTRHTQQRMIDLAEYINTLREIYNLVNTHPTFKHHFAHLRHMSKLFENKVSDNATRLLDLLKYDTFKGKPSYWFSYNGRTLATYALLQETKNELCDAIMAGGQLGALLSATGLYLDHQDTPARYSFVEFVNGDRPYIGATNLWNPRLDAHKAVPSSFEMGGSSAFNMVLTGGNGLGKSTIMKGLLYAMLIAQTFGIAPADRLVMTPFSRMICHTNVTDNVAAGLSGFTAELAMKDTILKEYTLLKPNEFAITVFDELFKSTNPDDAAQLSKQLCRSLAQYKNGMSIIATHLAPVTELETEGTHANYHPGSIPQGDGKPAKPTYTLEKGASFDHNAVALYNAGK